MTPRRSGLPTIGPMDGLDRLRSKVRATTNRTAAAVEAARRRWDSVDALFAAWERDSRLVGGALAGAVAFRLFVYLLPLFLAAVSLLGLTAGLGGDGAAPSAGRQLGLSGYLIDSVGTAAEESQRGLWALVPLALWAIYSAGLGTTKVLRAAHALAWDQPVQRLRKAWTGAVASLVLVVGVLAVVAGTQAVRHRSERAGLVVALVQVAVLIGLWWIASRLLPHHPAAGWRALLPGAVVVGLGVWALHVASVYLLARRVASASALYGSLGVAAAIMAWLYLLGRLLVASAMLNATLWERRRAPGDQPGAEATPAA
jgi:uncharacterized BrkB/YihY/UPF0761 family membrane protein